MSHQSTLRMRRRLGAALLATTPLQAAAVSFDTGDPQTKVRLDTTVKYSLAHRTANASSEYLVDPNVDDGNRNFRSGPISNRLDLLSEFDVSRQGLGLRLSAAAWYDRVYMTRNDNDSPATLNAPVSDPQRFSDHVSDLHGRRAEVLDAFVFGSFRPAGTPLTLRLGQFAQLMGESLFFSDNGVAAANAPIDIAKSVTVPSLQAKEVIIPVKQLLAHWQPLGNVGVTAYYQFEWKRNRTAVAGSYFGGTDFGPGADKPDRFFPPPDPNLPPGANFETGAAVTPRDSGQFGLALKYRLPSSLAEFGLYAARYHSKDVLPVGGEQSTPFYIRPSAPGGSPNPVNPFKIGEINFVYSEAIKVVGASANTNIGDANFGAEISVRGNTPLASLAVVDPLRQYDNAGNPGYAKGRSAHAQVSAIYAFGPSALWDTATFVAEVAGHKRIKVGANEAQLDKTANRSSWGLRVLIEPQYLQALPGLDIAVPVSVGYIPRGRSSVVTNFGGGFNKGGTASLGVNATYLTNYKFGFNYVGFIGKVGNGNPPVMDRDNISIYVQTTF